MNRDGRPDAILVGRGGGSIEDLWPFNEEIVARAVAASEIPVISAVGHETDFTICDFAADLRAPTPSAAAELAVPDRMELLAELEALRQQMRQAMNSVLKESGRRLAQISESRVFRGMPERLELQRVRLDQLSSALTSSMQQQMQDRKNRLAAASGKLDALSPLAVLSRGYAVACDEAGKPVSHAAEVRKGQLLSLKLDDGDLGCLVQSIKIRREKRSEGKKL